MNAKDEARKVIDSLPDESTLDDIIHALYLKAKFERGEDEIRRGKGISREAAWRMFANALGKADADFMPDREQPGTDRMHGRP